MISCNINKDELRTLVEQKIPETKERQLLEHLRGCRACQKQLGNIFDSGITSSQLSDQELSHLKSHVRQLVQENKQLSITSWQILIDLTCIQPAALAAANDQTSDQKLSKAALSIRFLYFEAICRKTDNGYWRAELTLPSAPTPETQLSIRVMDARGNPIPNGKLIFCDIEKTVTNGRCYISIAELRTNIKNQTISFRRDGLSDVKGIIELFPEEKEGF